MDGKTKKILNYLKKNGEAEALDISFGLNMDENFVQNALDSLVQENLVTSARNEQGKVFYNPASGESAAPPASAAAPKKSKGKTAAGAEDGFDEFVLENEAVNVITDTIATNIDDFSAAAPAPPRPAPPPAAPAPTTAVFEVEDDFAPKPKRAKKPAFFEVEDDSSPKPNKAARKPAPPPDTGADDDDFSPKPKKGREKAPAFDDDADDYDGAPKTKPSANLLAAAAAGIVLVIAAVLLSVAVNNGKTAAAIAAAERDLVKTLDFEAFKAEANAKIDSLTAQNKALATKIKTLEDRAAKAQDKPVSAAAKKGGRKR